MSTFLLLINFLSFTLVGAQGSILGAAWPVMRKTFNMGLTKVGVVAFFLASGVVLFATISNKINDKIGFGPSNLIGIIIMVFGQFCIAFSGNFISLCLFCFITGAGSGILEVTINNYVALNFKPKHMSWLHAFWGIGALSGPLLASFAIQQGSWNIAYLVSAFIGAIFVGVIIFALPLWPKHAKEAKADTNPNHPSSIKTKKVFDISFFSILPALLSFLFYRAFQTAISYWGSSYLVDSRNIGSIDAAMWVSFFFTGTMLCRVVVGFFTGKFNFRQITFVTQSISVVGIMLMVFPLGNFSIIASFFLMGFGVGSFFPAMIHDTPYYFGEDKAQRIITLEISVASFAGVVFPPFLGWLSNYLSMSVFPFLLLIYGLMSFFFYILLNIQAKKRHENYIA